MVVEIALEEIAVHFSKYNKIAGLCWKHSHLINPVLHTYKSAITITQKIHGSKVHLGKELMVIGVTCFREDKLYPVLAVPTCKIENAGDMEITLTHAMEQWNIPGAAASIGPVWSFATDGDAMCCAVGHKLFLKKLLSPESPLYSILNNMSGLNTMTGDAKVLILTSSTFSNMSFCTLICSAAGIVLSNSRVINSMMLSRYLVWLPAYDEASITKLLHSDDPQDIPQAIELLQAIVKFSKSQHSLLNNLFSTDVNTHTDLVSITLLSNLIESILIPFINTKLSLTEQVQSLSCYAHLAFSIFHVHHCLFMPFQLYYNTQTCVKNVIFNIAKQQLLDPYESFFLDDCRDDWLELMFGTAKDIDGMFNRHPELDPGHRRLNLGKQIKDVDHINQMMWRGDIISGHYGLLSAWK
ncbi:uncharacterized protein F5891DRAFT_1183480 [Suillus fuscotomentosus]|uniref:Uncharacterized protein n=1 Tax=Suillus fuscotomentosus TaxID=1912939 RepID=A0AAD4EGA5_9AGAM|nr:uncharacterized protein F5891DRAFT_1183480 [Suillus fuscotomentosus]KAG1905536.1 hypothetical protein F5891DRAFT_1183480 [Suillus fuscotomentosus]